MTMTLKPLVAKRAQNFEFKFIDRTGQERALLVDAYDRAEALSVLHEAVHCITDLLAAESKPMRPRYQSMPHEAAAVVEETDEYLNTFAQRYAVGGRE